MTTFHPLPPHPVVMEINTNTWSFTGGGKRKSYAASKPSTTLPKASKVSDKNGTLSSYLSHLGVSRSKSSTSDLSDPCRGSPWWKLKGSKRAEGWVKVVPEAASEETLNEVVIESRSHGEVESEAQSKTKSKSTKSVTWSDSTDTFISSSPSSTTVNSSSSKSRTKSALKSTSTSNPNQKAELKKEAKALKKEAKKQKRDEERRKRHAQLEQDYWYQEYDYQEWRDHLDAYRWAAVLYAL